MDAKIRSMYQYIKDNNEHVRDDQQIFIRYAAEHPDMVSLDVERQFFYTGYREIAAGNHLYLDIDLNLHAISRDVPISDIAVYHCNNMGSYNSYHA